MFNVVADAAPGTDPPATTAPATTTTVPPTTTTVPRTTTTAPPRHDDGPGHHYSDHRGADDFHDRVGAEWSGGGSGLWVGGGGVL